MIYCQGSRNLLCFLLISIYLSGTGSLKVTMGDSNVMGLQDEEAFIPCIFSNYSTATIEQKYLSITWTMTPLNGSVREVYMYQSGSHTPTRPGSNILDSDLLMGNGGIHLPRVQFSDEGDYTCTVFYTPDKAQGQSTLQVSAKPNVHLENQYFVIVMGTEKTVTCEAKGFYPKDITFRWVRYISPNQCVSMDKGTCTGEATKNPDGTFNVSSILTLNPTMEDDGNQYSCVVSHRSLDKEVKLNFTLTVEEPDTSTRRMVIAVVGTVVGSFLIFICIILFYIFIKEEPPKLSEITGAEYLVHMDKATLSCHISGYRPKPIKISLGLKRKDKEPMEIDSWKDEDNRSVWCFPRSPDRHHVNGDPEVEHLVGGQVMNNPSHKKPLRVEMSPTVKSSKKGIYDCHCIIHITPNIEEDDGAEFVLHVTHNALGPLSVTHQLKVNGVPPKVSKIVSPPRIIHGESMNLTCSINGFKPKPISVTWLKIDSYGQKTELLSWDDDKTTIHDDKYSHNIFRSEHEDNSSNCLSSLTMRPTVMEDHNLNYMCRILHHATGTKAEESVKMSVSADPVLDPIQRSLDALKVGEEFQLSCKVHSFHPETIGISWYKESEPLTSQNDKVLCNDRGLCYLTSNLRYTPCVKDLGKTFTCNVRHQDLENPKCSSWKLKHLICEPTVSEIKCQPEVPECDQPAVLSCTVIGFYPRVCTIRWYRGLETIPSVNHTETTREDQESGLFSTTTEMNFTPTVALLGTEFQVEVAHNMKFTKKKFSINIKGLPQLKDIICSKCPPKYGEELTLNCEVTGCNPQDVEAEWRENDRPVQKEMKPEKVINKDFVSFILKLTPTAQHYGKLFSCLVKHKDLPQPVKKNTSLRLPDVQPTLSEITAVPETPKANRESRFLITISGSSQKHLQVRWFKSFTEFKSNIQTSEPQIGKDGLYSCSSTLTFTPSDKDHGASIRCEVTANRERKDKLYKLDLTGTGTKSSIPIVPEPVKVEKIECLTPDPRKGQEVTLQCVVKGLDVSDGFFSWYEGIDPIDDSQVENQDLIDGSGCISTVRFSPVDDVKVRFEVTFNMETTRQFYELHLG